MTKVTMKSGTGSAPKKKSHAHRMMIERADNGFTSETHFPRPDKDEKTMREKGSYIPEPEPVRAVHKSHTELAKHVKEMFGPQGTGGGEGETADAGEPDADDE